jgi:hypothetical protein
MGLTLRLQNSGSGLVLDIGGNGGNGAWLQSTHADNLSFFYPILLNPNGGNVGIGIKNSLATLAVNNRIVGENGESLIVEYLTRSNSGITYNSVKNRLWGISTGTDWKKFKLHDGISIDGELYQRPIDDLTWYERDPYNKTHSWGSNGNTWMTINDGKVGIGTMNSLATLAVNNRVIGENGESLIVEYLTKSNSGTTYNSVKNRLWGISTGADWRQFKLHDGVSIDGELYQRPIDDLTWYERDPYNRTHSWGSEGNTWMTINDGNIGVGTRFPKGKLHIIGSSHSYPLTSGNSQAGLIMRLQNSGSNFTLDVGGNGGNGAWLQATNIDELNSNYSLLLNPNGGNVGIGTGTDAPVAKLDVRGTINACEVKVAISSGCDFVFAPDYRIRSLKEVEIFIKENQHLPEIDPAKKMESNGVNVSEMQMKLLQKIEEMTLYMIEQNKKIEEQNNELQALKNEINDLKVK